MARGQVGPGVGITGLDPVAWTRHELSLPALSAPPAGTRGHVSLGPCLRDWGAFLAACLGGRASLALGTPFGGRQAERVSEAAVS